MALFRKPPREFTINGEKVMIAPLRVGVLLQVQNLSNAVAAAVAKLRTNIINDYEHVESTTPKPTEKDADAIEFYKKTLHKAPEISMFSLMIRNKEEGIKALFDCLFKHDLLEEILITSVDRFAGMQKGVLFDPRNENGLDIPTALELFIAIVEVNAGGFAEMGKFSRLLSTFQGAVKAPASNSDSNPTEK